MLIYFIATLVVGITVSVFYLTISGKSLAQRVDAIQQQPITVRVERVQVESNDPERFVYGIQEAFADAVKNPTESRVYVRKGKK